MKNGHRIFDADTHVRPASEVLEGYADEPLRTRLGDLAPYRVDAGSDHGITPATHQYRVGTRHYKRILGEAEANPAFAGRHRHWKANQLPRCGVLDDDAASRLQDMDDEGVDAHFIVPASWTSVVGLDDAELEMGLMRAYHRYQADYCGGAPDRLKGAVIASALDVDASVREIQRWGDAPWAAAVIPVFSNDVPFDLPKFEPIWKAAVDHGLPIVHHSFTWNPPYFPGYRDLWDNIFLGRLASHPWGAMRFVAAFVGSGLMDRYPTLRLGTLECGFGWLPFWARRMDEQLAHVGGTAPLRQAPSDYLRGGRFFCNVEMHEGESMYTFVTAELGDEVLGYGSDYPHAESRFPHSPLEVLGWTSVPPDRMRKLLWDNAQRFFKHG